MLDLQQPTGRLITLRIVYPVALEDLAPFGTALRGHLLSQPGRFVTCCDLRQADVFPQPVSDGFLNLMKNDNPKMERVGFIVGDTAILGLQLERLIRAAGSPIRQSFRDEGQLGAWLGELLTPAENAALAAFLAAGRLKVSA